MSVITNLLASINLGGVTGYDATVLSLSPWGYWKLDETSITNGLSAADASGNAKTGTYNGTGWSTASGLFGGSVSCPLYGTARYTAIPQFTLASLQKLTLVAFIKSSTSDATARSVIGGDDNSSRRRWQFRMINGKLEFVTILPSVTVTTSVAGISDGNPHMVVAVFDPTLSAGSGVVKLYIDGALDIASTTSITITAGDVRPGIGVRGYTSVNDAFPGNIDNAIIYLSALTASDISALWAARNTP